MENKLAKNDKNIKLFLGAIIILVLLGGILYYGYSTKSQKLVKGWNLPTVKYINESELLENKIPKKYREVASIKSLEEYLKIKKDLNTYIDNATSGSKYSVNTLRYAEVKMDYKYNKGEFFKNIKPLLASDLASSTKSDILYFVLHNFIETGYLFPTIYMLKNTSGFENYIKLLESSPVSKEYADFVKNGDKLVYEDKAKIHNELNYIISKDYPSVAMNGMLAHSFMEDYIRGNKKDNLLVQKSLDNYNIVRNILSEQKKDYIVTDYIVGLNQMAMTNVLYKENSVPNNNIDSYEMLNNSLYLTKKYKTNYTAMTYFVYNYVLVNEDKKNQAKIDYMSKKIVGSVFFMDNFFNFSYIKNESKYNPDDFRLFSLNTLKDFSDNSKEFKIYLESKSFDFSKIK